jgi:hypothetical protein
LVTDTNVWIDFHAGRICRVAVSLPYNWIAPDLVIGELRDERSGACVLSLGVRSVGLTGEQVEEVTRLGARYRGVSVIDLAALVLTGAQGGTLLTGDRLLRAAAEQEGVEVHGTLWLLDQLVTRGRLASHGAAAALQQMVDAGRRLPADEVRRRLELWQGTC